MFGGLFSYFSSAKAEEVPIINEDDTKELTKMIENMKNVTISEEMLSFEYNLVLMKGSMMISDEKSNMKSSLDFNTMKFEGAHQGDENKFSIRIRNVSVNYCEDNISRLITKKIEDNNANLIEFEFKANYINDEEHKDISLKLNPQDIYYNKKFTQRFV